MSRPKVFVNSVPKSGTNLLQSILIRFPGLSEQRRLGLNWNIRLSPLNLLPIGGRRCEVDVKSPYSSRVSAVRLSLSLLRPGRFCLGHVPYSEDVEKILASLGIQPIIVIRDPRDVVVSSVRYALRSPRHWLYEHLSREPDNKRRLISMIEGGVTRRGRPFIGIGEQIHKVLGWVESTACLTVRFEDVVGPQGNGSAEVQARTIVSIAEWIGIELGDDEAHRIGDEMFGTGRTFRSGKIASWRDDFDDEVEELFRRRAGDAARRLGY